MTVLRMRPMTLWEIGASTGDVALTDLLDGRPARGRADLNVVDYVTQIVRGGWPGQLNASTAAARRFLRGYVDLVVERDISAVDGQRRDPARLRRFLHAYAQLSAHAASLNTIAKRARGAGEGDEGLTWHTADAYRDAAERLMLIEDVPGWSAELRSRAVLVELPKRHLVDPSLAAVLLGADERRLIGDLRTLGFLFESLATRDLRVYAQLHDAHVFHYRERSGDLEIDLIVERADGTWIGIEVKLGPDQIDQAAAGLRRLADARVARPPAALVVITTGSYAYRRPDGVDVVPLGALRP